MTPHWKESEIGNWIKYNK